MKPVRMLRRTITWAGVGIAGGAVLVMARHLLATPQPLESTLTGEGRIDRRREGDIYYNIGGPEAGDPLLLLHDFYPGASNYEMRRIFPRLAADYRVYAPDWLGFGMSERPALAYTGEFYAHLLTGFLRETVGRPAIVVAHGLASNIAVRAASDEPELFARLVLVAPHAQAGMEPGPTVPQTLVRLAQRTSLGLLPYAALATRPAVRWQVSRRAARPGEGGATDDAVDHIYASAHQFGGHHALLALLTGELDLPMQNAFALLEPPVLVVGGERDTLHPRAQLEDLALLNPHAQIVTVPGAADAVFEDEPASFVERVGLWLRTPRERHVSPLREARTEREAPGTGEAAVSGGIVAPSAPEAEEEAAALAREIEAEAPAAREPMQTEQFGEPRGLVTPAPGLEALEGLQERAPEAPSTAETRTVGKPEGERGETTGGSEAPAQALGDAGTEAAATLQTAELLAELEERAGIEAERLDQAIREEAPGTVTEGTTTEVEAEAPGAPAARTEDVEKPSSPSQAMRGEGRQTSAHTEPTPGKTRQSPGRAGGTTPSGRASAKGAKGAQDAHQAGPGANGQKPRSPQSKRGHK